ncbi:Molybdenum transport system permease protein ModB [Geodia barretti]|uniref:Molybdenum transport system permease protein ModB n=1 Tax=Geodia barretti TaxID=519541 RepID=A0AA35R3Q1_GEOBA|nr:Molybdenum transport system permease protein ModB [Geodia barretti]
MLPPDRLVQAGISELPCIGDGRQSGTSASPSILNASPEATVGGGLAFLKTGDRVRIDLNTCTVNVLISDRELAQRKKDWKQTRPDPPNALAGNLSPKCGATRRWRVSGIGSQIPECTRQHPASFALNLCLVIFPTPEEYTVLVLSLKVGVLCVVISLPFAVLLGWVLARKNFRGKLILDGLCHLPLVLPPVVVGYLLLLLLGRRGFLGQILSDWFGLQIAFTWRGAVLAAAVVGFPLMLRAVRLAIESVDPRLERAEIYAHIAALRAFFSITLRLAAPGVLVGSLLTFARSLGEFGATITFVSNIDPQTHPQPHR